MKALTKLAAVAFLSAASLWSAGGRAKNVILFIGDAGGIPTLHAASVQKYGNPAKLFVQNMPNIALSDTSSAADWVSDSAAGMTAIVTGKKTRNGVLSQSDTAVRGKQDGAILKTILEYAEERGLSTGVVSNSAMTDATPAACYAHANDRKETGKIFAQALAPSFGDGVDVIIGPGRAKIVESTRALGIDIASALSAKGYYFGDSVAAIPQNSRRAVVLFDDEDHDLAKATDAAIKILSRNPKGFFLMVESDLHTDKLERGLERAVSFDQLIEKTARQASRDTLLLFTADHSFDLRISTTAKKGESLLVKNADGKVEPVKGLTVFGHHGAEQVLLSAQGPGAERVKGFLANTDVFRIMLAAYGWKETAPAAAAGSR